MPEPIYFASQHALRTWFEKHHRTERELLVGYYKVGTGRPSLTWSESVDQALCFGWIDGVRRSVDDERYCIRFTPRKSKSIWSAVNIRKVESLTAQGLMRKAGIDAYGRREETHSRLYAYENRPLNFTPRFEQRFRADAQAWDFFCSQSPTYRKTAIAWVMTAKQESTRQRRLETLVADSGAGEKIRQLRRP